MNPSGRRALIFAVALTATLALLHVAGVGLWLLLAVAVVFAVAALLLPWLAVRWFDDAATAARHAAWAAEEGRHHAFEGVSIGVRDDGRHAWLAGADLQRVLRTEDANDVLAARHSGRWRRDDDGGVWLRADAVVERLSTMPGRAEPRTIKLRRWVEREVIFPIERGRERGLR